MIMPIEDKTPRWIKALVALIVAILVFNELSLALGAVEESSPTSGDLNQVAYEYDDGTYSGSGAVATIAQHDKNVYSGIIFPDIVVPSGAIITEANLTLYYWNNLNYTETPTNILIEAIPGDPSVIYPGLLRSPAVTTASYYTYDISGWDAEGNYTLDITDILTELHLGYTWDETGNNVLIRIMALAPTGPGSSPDYYRYEISTNLGPANEKPVLSINYTTGTIYKDWTLTPTNNSYFQAFIVDYTTSGSILVVNDGYSWETHDLPFSTYGPGANVEYYKANDKAIIRDDVIYIAGVNDTDSNLCLYNSSVDDLDNWENIQTLSSYTLDDYGITYSPVDDIIYVFYMHYQGDPYYKLYFPANDSLSSQTQVRNAWTDWGSALDSVYEPLNQSIWVAYGSVDTTGSRSEIVICKFINGSMVLSVEESDPADEYYYPVIDEHMGRVYVFYWVSGYGGFYYTVFNGTTNDQNPNEQPALGNCDNAFGADTLKDVDNNYLYFLTIDTFDNDELKRGRWDSSHTHTTNTLTARRDIDDLGSGYAPPADDFRYIFRHDFNNETVLSVGAYDDDRFFAFADPDLLDTADNDYLTFWSPYELNYAFTNEPEMTDTIQFNQTFFDLGDGNYWITPPPGENGSCVEAYLLANYGAGPWAYSEIIGAIDSCNTDDPDNPGAGDFEGSEPWYVSRKGFKLYFLLLGIFFIGFPWILFASDRDPKWIGYILFFNTMGLGLLWAMVSM